MKASKGGTMKKKTKKSVTFGDVCEEVNSLGGKKTKSTEKSGGKLGITRKQKRKELRRLKKARKHAFLSKQKLPEFRVNKPEKDEQKEEEIKKKNEEKEKKAKKRKKRAEKEEEKQWKEVRRKQLLEANEADDRMIKMIGKRLKLNRRKSQNVPMQFVNDGLDYILEACDPKTAKNIREIDLQESGSEFEDDVALISGKQKDFKLTKVTAVSEEQDNRSLDSDHENEDSGQEEEVSDTDEEVSDLEEEVSDKDEEISDHEQEVSDHDNSDHSDEGQRSGTESEASDNSEQEPELTEDIYGRFKDREGNIVSGITNSENAKYTPPMKRANEQNPQQMALRRQLKGLLNRLSESNMVSIANEIESLYMKHSRYSINESLSYLILESIVQPALTPERLIQEHAMLIAVLHANVGTEIGAHFLQSFATRFNDLHQTASNEMNKQLDNVVSFLVHLYSFKVIHPVLIYGILNRLAERFSEKDLEMILLILRCVGFNLRKDDPIALKEMILKLQDRGQNAECDQSRVRFMLDILMAIRNNNMHRIPNYDPSHIDHLRKTIKGILHKGCAITELRISLQDVLNADTRGRWWIVGSAWEPTQADPVGNPIPKLGNVSERILELARKQRMNTDVRRNVFCIVMSAQDYVDAFEKLLQLGLRHQQEREILAVIIECCVQEKTFNPYYAHLVQKFCDAHPRFQLTTQFSLWDRIRGLSSLSVSQVTNLAQFTAHLILHKGLSLNSLKIIEFAELEKLSVRFLRQVLLAVLLHGSDSDCVSAFGRISSQPKLKPFRESLRLFLCHFLQRNTGKLDHDSMNETLTARLKLAEKVLSVDAVSVKL